MHVSSGLNSQGTIPAGQVAVSIIFARVGIGVGFSTTTNPDELIREPELALSWLCSLQQTAIFTARNFNSKQAENQGIVPSNS